MGLYGTLFMLAGLAAMYIIGYKDGEIKQVFGIFKEVWKWVKKKIYH